MVQTLNETAIYHIKILTQHKMAPDTIQYSFKINFPCMKVMKTCCFEINFNLQSLSNCNFWNEIFFSDFIHNFS